MRERLPLHDGKARRALGAVALHELHARGRVEKQVAHDDRRARRAAGGRVVGDDAGLEMQRRAAFVAGAAGHQVDARDGRDGRERFAAEAERADGV